MRINKKESREIFQKTNPERQWGNSNGDSMVRFQKRAGEIIELFCQFIEEQMPLPPNSGAGCRVQAQHVDLAYFKLYKAMREFMDGEKNE